MRLRFTEFSPTEAASITGVRPETQRNWRRFGYLPPLEGSRAAFTLPQLLRMRVLALAGDRGIGPKDAVTFAGEAARALYLAALWELPIFSEAIMRAASEEASKRISPHLEARLRKELGDDYARQDLILAGARAIIVEAGQALAELRGATLSHWLIVWADGDIDFALEASELLEDLDHCHPKLWGPVLLLPIRGIAAEFASRLPRPALDLADG